MSIQIKYAIISLLLLVAQTTIARTISLGGVLPDILLIWIVYLALNLGQLRGTVWGFGIGLLSDLLAGEFLGLSALSKTLAGFVAGYFYNENKTHLTLGSYRYLFIVLLVSLMHNILYFFVFTLGTEMHFLHTALHFGLTTTLYTAIVALIPMFILQRKLSL